MCLWIFFLPLIIFILHSALPVTPPLPLLYSSLLLSSLSPSLTETGVCLAKGPAISRERELSLQVLETEYFLTDFLLFGLFCQGNENGPRGPLSRGGLEGSQQILFFFPSWFLTNASRRSLRGPGDNVGSSITSSTEESEPIISGLEEEMPQPKPSWDCVPSKGDLMDGFCPEGLLESQIDSSLAVLPPFWFYTQSQ